jgi:hypothetical protein
VVRLAALAQVTGLAVAVGPVPPPPPPLTTRPNGMSNSQPGLRGLWPAGRTGTGLSLRQNQRMNALDPGFHCARTRWIRGFMTFRLARHTQTVMLTVPA